MFPVSSHLGNYKGVKSSVPGAGDRDQNMCSVISQEYANIQFITQADCTPLLSIFMVPKFTNVGRKKRPEMSQPTPCPPPAG